MKNNFGLDAMNTVSGHTNPKQHFLTKVKKFLAEYANNFLTQVQNDKYLLLGPL
jgi:hypothetical protein